MPRSKKISELRNELESVQSKLFTATTAAQNLDLFQEKYKEAQQKFKLALELLPDKKEIPSLLESVSKSGKDSGLEFILFQPGQEVPKDFYAEIPVKIQVTGGYHNLAMFFDRVGRLSRIVNILNINLKNIEAAPGVGQGILTASCVAMTYRFLEAVGTGPTGAQ